MKAERMLEGTARGARYYGDEETATEAEFAAAEVNELHAAALSLFDAVRHNPAPDYIEVKTTARARLKTVLMRIEEEG